jgi:hypothetical protein
VDGLEGGVYYYHPVRNELQRAGGRGELPAGIHAPANQPIAAGAAFSIFLIADLQAIAPLYGDLAPDFVKLEAGYMGQLLMEGALPNGLGLCPVGYVWFDEIRPDFQIGADHLLVHSFLGGVYAGAAQSAAPAPATQAAAAMAAGSIEDRIAAIWGAVLRRPQLNRDENFFEAGGTSFASIEVHRRIVEQLGIACTITDLFRHPTVGSLAAHLAQHAGATLPAAGPAVEGGDAPLRRDRRRAARAAAGGEA